MFSQCAHESNCHLTVLHPYQVLAELKKLNFTLLNQSIQFDENGDPKFGSYSIIVWKDGGAIQEVGFYAFQPSVNFFINNTKIQWYTKKDVSITEYGNNNVG